MPIGRRSTDGVAPPGEARAGTNPPMPRTPQRQMVKGPKVRSIRMSRTELRNRQADAARHGQTLQALLTDRDE